MPMILCLLLAWVIVFNVMMNGSESSGGQLYFIAFFPYVVLTLFLIMGLIQDGGPEGLVVSFVKKSWHYNYFHIFKDLKAVKSSSRSIF